MLWGLFQYNLVSSESTTLLSWIVLVLFSAILAAGMSWAHLRNRWSGQATVDEVDTNERSPASPDGAWASYVRRAGRCVSGESLAPVRCGRSDAVSGASGRCGTVVR